MSTKDDLFRNADVVTIHLAAQRPHPRPRHRQRARSDEEDGLPRQHVARADRRREGAARRAEQEADRRRRTRRVRRRAAADSIIRIRKMDNVVITPHLGYVSQQNYESIIPTSSRTSGASWTASRPASSRQGKQALRRTVRRRRQSQHRDIEVDGKRSPEAFRSAAFQGEQQKMASYKLVTYQSAKGPRAGVVVDDKLFDAAALTRKAAYASDAGHSQRLDVGQGRPEEGGRGGRQEQAQEPAGAPRPSCSRRCCGRRRSIAPAPITPIT